MAEEEAFKVTDRRRGRDDPTAADTQMPSGEGTPPSPTPKHQDIGSERPRRAPVSAGGEGPDAGARDLRGVFLMFASSALIHLGEAADPVSGERTIDLEQARNAIDTLLLLREKTHGNLSSEEGRLLEDVLYDLQMRFVRATSRR
jgi:Domain of unknown function (DUF1844)